MYHIYFFIILHREEAGGVEYFPSQSNGTFRQQF